MTRDPRDIQKSGHQFPYHHLPVGSDGGWSVGRHYHWGLDYLALLEAITAQVQELDPGSILDFGCGDGRLLLELSRNVDSAEVELCGVDIDERALRYARAFNEEDRVRFANGLEELAGRQFDLLLAAEVIEHIPPEDCPAVVEQLSKLLKPDGRFIVSVPTTVVPVIPKHYRHFTVSLLEETLGKHFELQSVRYLQRHGFMNKLLTRVGSNRFFVANWKPLLRWLRSGYNRWVKEADASSGVHLIAVFSRRAT